jgi:hypothetical protein
MKRIKLRQHKYLALYQTLTDAGQPIAFEICRPGVNPVKPLIKTIPAPQSYLAHNLFNTLSFLMELYGPSLNPRIKRLILTGRGIHKRASHQKS